MREVGQVGEVWSLKMYALWPCVWNLNASCFSNFPSDDFWVTIYKYNINFFWFHKQKSSCFILHLKKHRPDGKRSYYALKDYA